MKSKHMYQNKTVGLLSKAIACNLACFLCLILITIITTNAYSQNTESNFGVVISTVSRLSEEKTITKNTFKAGEAVQIKVEITNLSDKVINIPKGIGFSRPTLFHDGQLVPYRKEVSAQFKKGEGGVVSGILFPKPNESQSEILDLRDFYEPLKPGQYQLSLERRFFKTGSIESNAITFKIIPCNGNSQ